MRPAVVVVAGLLAAAVLGPTAPVSASTAEASPILAVEGADGHLHVSTGGGAWKGEGGALDGPPAVFSQFGVTYYFARWTDGRLHVRTAGAGWALLSTTLQCATAPAVAGDNDDGYAVACVAPDGHLDAVVGALPYGPGHDPTGTVLESPQGGFDTDTTATPGGVGGRQNDGILFYAPGVPYASTSAHAAGNTYAITVDRGTGVVATAPAGISCADAPAVGVTHDEDGHETDQSVICHAPQGNHTLVYQQIVNGTDDPAVYDLGGNAAGGPAVVERNYTTIDVFFTNAAGKVREGCYTDSGFVCSFGAYRPGIAARPGVAADKARTATGLEILPSGG